MKANINYKSKKAIIITIILVALIAITTIAVMLFVKGNDNAEAIDGNTVENTINNAGENTSSKNDEEKEQNNNELNKDNEQQENNINNEENIANNENETQENENNNNKQENTNNNVNNNQDNTNNNVNENNNQQNTNNNQGNIPNQEFVTERVEIIPERVIAENYYVSWKPTQFETLINGTISFEKADITAEKTVAKVTANGFEANPESVKVGEILQYTITLTNKNNKVNGIINVKDEIPEGTEFVTATKQNLETIPEEYENSKEVKILEWKNIKVEAGSKVELVVYVKVVAKVEEKETIAVQNIATIYEGTTEEEVPSPETKVANITANKTSKIIYNKEKPHEHIIENGKEPLHEQDIIEYTITLTNVGEGVGTVKVSDTVPEGTTFIKDGVVTVVDQNGTKTFEISDLEKGINVTVPGKADKTEGTATVTFRVIVNVLETETKVIRNEMAKVDNESTNTTEDIAEKLYVDLSTTKVWNDDNNKAGVRPENVEFVLVQDGQETDKKLTANEGNGWKLVFENLNKYTAEGNEIVYTVKEIAVNHYNTEYSKDYKTVTNTIDYLSIKTEKEVTKIWNDDNNKIGIRPENVEFVLVQDGQETDKKLTANEGNGWKVVFENLNKYTAEGNKIVYTIKEIEVNHYNTEYSEDHKTVTNTIDYLSIKTEKQATKVWENTESDAAKAYEITSITLQLKANGEVAQEVAVTEKENWAHTFTNLNKYDENGNEIVYEIDEKVTFEEDAEKLEKYNKVIDGNTITNTFDPSKVQDETVELTATKVWKNTESDAAKAYQITSITLQVKANGEVVQEVAVTEKENWTHTFTGLKKYDENGNEIVYEIDEKVRFEQDAEKLEKYNKVIDGNTITNTFDPSKVQDETIEITATKVWKNIQSDAAKDYAITSIILQVRVYGQDGAYALAAVKEVTEKENWTHTFTGLKKYDVNGNEIKYVIDETVNEEDTEKLEKYDKVVEGNTITNTFNPNKVQEDKTEITVTKVWEDDNNKAGVRPENVEFVLVQDGQETDKKLTANEATGWKVVFENLNKYTAEGKEIVYTIKEVAVEHYTTEYSEDYKTVTNTIDYTSIKTSKTITKIWEDNSNKYGTRPQNVVLSFNGVNYTLTAGNDENKETTNEWTLTINNLQKYDAQGNEIIYTVTEPTVPTGYTKTENGLIVTNVANEIVEKTAHKENEDGTIGNEVTNTDIFEANDVVYYKLIFKNAGNTVIENKTLTDTLPARLKLLAVAGTEITESSETGTDSYGYTWQVSENNDGNVVIDWTISSIEAGESKELVIKAQVQTEYKDLCQKNGNQTENTAKLNIVKDGTTVNSVGTVYLNTAVLPELGELSQNADIEKMLKNNNTIVDIVEKGTTRDAIKQSLQSSGVTLESNEVILWYKIENANNEIHIYGEIRKISEITTINNAVYMDNEKQDEVEIKTEDIEIGQSGTVTVNVTSTTTATVSNPMDVVFVIDTSGSMQGTNATNMVNAVNKSIKTIMAKNADTRIGIVGFSGNSSQSITNSSTIIPLGKYAQNTNYLRLQNNTIYSTVTNNSRAVTGGTNTGAGIKAGAEMLTSQTTTTFTTTVNGVSVTGTRTPVLILVTDGEPTYYYGNETATGTRTGNGQNTDENYYYWTIRNAKYYKDAITTKYYAGTQKQAKVFTIGIGMSGELATTMLNPNQTNVDSCNDNSSDYRPSEKKRLYNLLNSNGTPYAYSYADGSKTGELTETDIENFLTSSLNASVESMEVRAITTEESKARRINLENIDISKPFVLEIIEETPIKYTTLAEAQSAGYVKIDTETNMYYVDLSNITRETTININYWEE